jgi:hypothetical protein
MSFQEPATASEIYNRALAVKLRMGLLPRRNVVAASYKLRMLPPPAPKVVFDEDFTRENPAEIPCIYTGPFTVSQIAQAVAKVNGMTVELLFSASRFNFICYARQCFFYLCRVFSDASTLSVATKVGMNHATAFHAYDQVSYSTAFYRPMIEAIVDVLMGRSGPVFHLHPPNVIGTKNGASNLLSKLRKRDLRLFHIAVPYLRMIHGYTCFQVLMNMDNEKQREYIA